jgi:hypothetical protein
MVVIVKEEYDYNYIYRGENIFTSICCLCNQLISLESCFEQIISK